MCRWLADRGPSLRLSDLLTRPDHSLIDQSRHATQNVETTNADGHGIGWYGDGEAPGVYRDTHPAWNDTNSQHLVDHIHSRLWTVRYSSNNQSRTQYHSRHIHALRDIHGTYEPVPDGAVILLSEPLDELSEHWESVPESSLLVVEDGTTTVSSFSPE